MKNISNYLSGPCRLLASGAPVGFDALILAHMAGGEGKARTILFIATDDVDLARMAEALAFFAPQVERLEFPAWDCLPYDRVSPHGDVVSTRIHTLSRLLEQPDPSGAGGRVILSTVSSVLQRVQPRDTFSGASLSVVKGQTMAPETVTGFLESHGYGRTGTVMEPGEYAIRGGIIDVFAPGPSGPVRIDFFGDQVDGIRLFDAGTQRTSARVERVDLRLVSEVVLNDDSISRFRSGYRALFGAVGDDDPLYGSVTAGHRHMGAEHWLPLFHERMETVFDYVPGAVVVLDYQAEAAKDARLDLIVEYYQARATMEGMGAAQGGAPYHPVPTERMFLDADEWDRLLEARAVVQFFPFATPEATPSGLKTVDVGGRPGREFADARVNPEVNVFDALGNHITDQQNKGRRVVIAAVTEGSRERLRTVLAEHGADSLRLIDQWTDVEALDRRTTALAVIDLARGFTTDQVAVITEQDILGDRLSRPARRRIRPENFITESSSLMEGDLVVHADHGIGRYDGLEAIQVAGAPHDCLRLIYAGDDKLFLPVENIEVISRYGSEDAAAQLDRLGGAGWQARKAKLKKRIRDMADELIRIAATRELKPSAAMFPPEGLYEEFCARFPFTETEDQRRAIDAAVGDLSGGRPADRLICGDVGFGKTEVALRAAFVTALSGRQVAVVVPTTLLSRQHLQTFTDRFAEYPVRIEQLSRMVSAAKAKEIKAGLKDGTVDIVIGTHALLAKDLSFRDLGLLVIDEEQHFGVGHKERLKKLKSDVHVLTLTATPIPRTLQLALSGVREMSLIATPPVDRLAVRTFVLPFDPVIVREAILRERFRGGQVFYVCPRVADLASMEDRLAELVPEVSVVTVHGRMAVRDLEKAITAFYDGAYDVLLSTNIIESGLDLPSVNTIIIHRAHMFGLSQLYQLRGRVGRSKVRAYAYLTLPPRQKLPAAAEKRLEIMQTLDSLGAGFTLASHDLDIRGAGNLLGEEQTGHIREVGIELYQQMLEEAVAEARGLDGGAERDWSPQISIGLAVLIPEAYVADLTVRMGLYRRMAGLKGTDEIEAFAAELIDRFGPLPEEVDNLLQTVAVKCLCRDAGVDRVDAGPKGAVVGFRNDHFANPEGLVYFITKQAGTAKLRPDHRLVYMRGWEDAPERLRGVKYLMGKLAEIAAAGKGS